MKRVLDLQSMRQADSGDADQHWSTVSLARCGADGASTISLGSCGGIPKLY